MGVDPFAALGIDQPQMTMAPPADGGDAIPTMRVTPKGTKTGIDPFKALGIDASQEFKPVEQPPPSQYPVGPGQISGMRANLGARMHEGVVGGLAQVAGAPADLAINAPNFLLRTLGLPQIPSGSESIKHALSGGIVGFPTEQIVPGNAAEAYLGKAASGVGSMLATGGLAGAIPAAGKVVEGLKTAASPSGLAMGAGGGVAGEAARRAVPERYGQAAEMAGNAAGMGLTGGALMAGGKAFRAAGDYVGGMGIGLKETVAGARVTPAQQRAATGMVNEALGSEGTATLAQSGRIEARARELESILADPKARADERIAARTELDGIQTQREQVVPGHEPTLAQIVPSPDVKALEKVSRTTNDAAFGARDAGNNNALVGAVRGLAPETAEPGSVGRFFTAQLDALEQAGEREIATQRAAGERSVAETQQAGEGAVAGARQAVGQAGEALGGMGTPEAHGEALRGHLETVNAAAKAREKALWEAIDPDGTLALPLGSVQETARSLIRDMNPNLGDIVSGQEHQILAGAAALPEVVPFRDAQRLRSNIGFAQSALRAVPGNEQSLRRLGMLKSALDGAIADGAEAAARGDGGVATRLAALKEKASNGSVPGGGSGEGNSQVPGDNTGGTAGLVREGGGPRSGEQRSQDGASPGGVAVETADHLPGDLSEFERGVYADLTPAPKTPPLEPNFSPEAANDYAAAREATLARKQTFGQGAIGRVLQPGPQGAEFRVETAAVPRAFLTGNAVEPARVQKYIEAVGGLPQAVTAMRDALVNDLRNQRTRVIMDDGTVSAKGLADWTRNHARTIDQFPGLRDQLGTVEKMQAAYDSTVAAAKAAKDAASEQAALELTAKIKGHERAVKDFNQSPGGKFVASEAMDAFKKVMASDTRTEDFASMVRAAKGKPEVVDGLRRLVADYIEERFGTGAPSGDTENFLRAGALRNWIEVRRAPLKEILGGQGLQNLEAVGAVLRRQQLATSRPAVAGSDTAQKAIAAAKHGMAIGGHSIGPTAFALIGEHLMESAGHGISHSGFMGVMAPAVGIAAGTGLHFLRQAGIRTRNDLVREMLLNPALTREMQAKVADARLSPLTKNRIARAMLAGTTLNQQKER